jgi:hypothetical protein
VAGLPACCTSIHFAAGVVPVWTESDSCHYRLKENQGAAREKPLESGWISTRCNVSPNQSPPKSNNRVSFTVADFKGADRLVQQAG